MRPRRLNLPTIEGSLRSVSADFDLINRSLSVPRDPMTDEVCANLMAGYQYVDELIARSLDLFQLGNSHRLLELNTQVLCGNDEAQRRAYAQHISSTAKRFYEQEGGGVGALMEWRSRHLGEDVWRRAAGTYVHILSRPELYIEGNHRTGALVMSYLLAREGRPPFVLSPKNAKAYFEPSSLAKVTKKRSLGMLVRIPKLRRQIAKLLKDSADERFLLRSP